MSTYAVNLANGTTDEKGFFRLLGKLFNQSGVIESTALTVSAQGTPTMSLNISGSAASDNAVFITANGDTYHGWNTAQTTVTIAANSTGNTMIDSVVAYINLGAGIATANNPGGLVFTSVRGASANTAPTPTAIQNAIGANNPYIVLANVTVGNGVSSINSGNISDQRPFASNGNIAASAWTSFTPTWTTSGTAPSLGNGTFIGNYYRTGRKIHVEMFLLFGSTTNAGTGTWFFTYPVAPNSRYNTMQIALGNAHTLDSSAPKDYSGDVTAFDATRWIPRIAKVSAATDVAGITNTYPSTWASGFSLSASFTYEAAS